MIVVLPQSAGIVMTKILAALHQYEIAKTNPLRASRAVVLSAAQRIAADDRDDGVQNKPIRRSIAVSGAKGSNCENKATLCPEMLDFLPWRHCHRSDEANTKRSQKSQ